jgi:hypothetical protein
MVVENRSFFGYMTHHWVGLFCFLSDAHLVVHASHVLPVHLAICLD